MFKPGSYASKSFCHAFIGRHCFINVGSHLEMREREPLARTAQVGNPSSTLASARVFLFWTVLQRRLEQPGKVRFTDGPRIELRSPLLCCHGRKLGHIGFGDAVVRDEQGHPGFSQQLSDAVG